MIKKNILFPALCLWLCFFALTGCVRRQVMESSTPDWVNLGSGLYLSDQGRVVSGVGVALGLDNRMLLRASADNMARKELVGVLGKYTQALFDEASVAITDADQVDPANQSLGALNQTNLRRSVIVDHWMDMKNEGRVYSLCRLDLNVYKEILSRHTAIPAQARKMMLDLADRQHGKMMQP